MTVTENPPVDEATHEQVEEILDEARAAEEETTSAAVAEAEQAQEPAHPALMVSGEQMALIKSVLNRDLSDGELMLFAQVCNRVGLDPFAKQIYAVKRQGKMTIQTGIDGFRLIARRTGRYGGRLGAYFCGTDGEWRMTPDGKPKPWLENEYPAAAMVGVVVKGDLEPTWGIAKWAEYAVDPTTTAGAMWKKMPTTMLAKCAEAQALRAAFPAETSGLYTDDEMMQADAIEATASVSNLDELADEAVRLDLLVRVAALPDELRSVCRERWKNNDTLAAGDGLTTAPMNLRRRQVGAANAIVNGCEAEAKKDGWVAQGAFDEIRRQLHVLNGQEEPVTDSSPPADAPAGEETPEPSGEQERPQVEDRSALGGLGKDAADGEGVQLDEAALASLDEEQRAVVETVAALPLKAVDKRLTEEYRIDVRGKTGQQRRGLLAEAILTDQARGHS